MTVKVYLILGLLLAVACAERKINLEDIERDNLRAESKTKTENIQTEETKYSVKPDVNQHQYRILGQYNNLGGRYQESYIPPQQFQQDVKYIQVSPERYIQPNQYAVHEAQYQQSNQILPEQNIQPLQYYNGYQQQAEVLAKGATTNAFESQKLNYQPEVVVGNHIQSVQQKAVTEKYTKAVNKGPIYLGLPTTQLLSYYPHFDINTAVGVKDVRLAQPSLQLVNDAGQISLPVYAPVYNQKQLIPSVKATDQYSTVVPVTFTNKILKASASSYKDRLPATSKKLSLPPQPTPSLHVQPQQPFVQGKKLLHTQAYITPTQPQYVQQLVYAQPGVIYSDPTASYSDLYSRIPAYIPDNSLRGQVNQYQTQQQFYIMPMIEYEPKEVLQEQINQDPPQNYVKVPEEPRTHFIPPQLPAQDFKSGITQLEPVSYEDEESLPVKDHSPPLEPKSLLDTYIPSKVIAAQDSARYRERPIKLEVFSSQK